MKPDTKDKPRVQDADLYWHMPNTRDGETTVTRTLWDHDDGAGERKYVLYTTASKVLTRDEFEDLLDTLPTEPSG